MTLPRISVVMAVHNGARYLRESVESVLAQTWRDFEFIIVDDGSTDATPAILNEYEERDGRVRVIHNPENIGQTRSLNRGLAVARGEFVARQDADDLSLPERLARQVAFLDAPGHGDVAVLGTVWELIDADGAPISTSRSPLSDTAIRWHSLFNNPFCHTSAMFRRSLLETSGERGYDEGLRYCQDYDLWARLLRHGRGANLPDALVRFRYHAASISAVKREEQQRLAVGIAQREMERLPGLAGRVTEADAAVLRRWSTEFPSLLTREDMRRCRLVLALLRAFRRMRRTCRRESGGIRDAWVAKIGASLYLRDLRAAWQTGLLPALLRTAPRACLHEAAERTRRKPRSHIGGGCSRPA